LVMHSLGPSLEETNHHFSRDPTFHSCFDCEEFLRRTNNAHRESVHQQTKPRSRRGKFRQDTLLTTRSSNKTGRRTGQSLSRKLSFQVAPTHSCVRTIWLC
jgi:hypothetical protein